MECKALIASPVWLLHRVAARDSSFSGRAGKSDRKRGERRTICLFVAVMEQIHILGKISASSPADLSQTEETDASGTPGRHKYSNANNSLCPMQEKSFACISNKPPRMMQHPRGVCQSCRWQHSQLPITCQTHRDGSRAGQEHPHRELGLQGIQRELQTQILSPACPIQPRVMLLLHEQLRPTPGG